MSLSLRILAGAGLLVLATSASAVDLKSLGKTLGSKSQSSATPEASSGLGALGGLSLPAVGGDTAGNAAGVLEYCVKRKYLSGGAVATVKDKLMSKYGLGDQAQVEQDTGYQSGLQGLLQGSDGKSFNLDSVSDKLKDKACDYVLENATSLV